MSAMPSPAQSEFSADSLPKPSVGVPIVRPADLKNDRSPSSRPPLGKRTALALARFLITFCIGAAATVAWQSYGDAALEMVASSFPQLGWLAPQPAPIAQNAAEMTALAAAVSPSRDQQQLNAMSLDLDAMRQSVDRIVATQEETTRNIDRISTSQERVTRGVDQLAAGQEQMTREITKLQVLEQYILYKNSEPPPRPAPAPARNPAPRAVPIQPTPARNP
jgi:hypothetical protein